MIIDGILQLMFKLPLCGGMGYNSIQYNKINPNLWGYAFFISEFWSIKYASDVFSQELVEVFLYFPEAIHFNQRQKELNLLRYFNESTDLSHRPPSSFYLI